VFAFFADPANLPPLMPSWQRARVEQVEYVSPPESPPSRRKVAAGQGSLITISFRPIPCFPCDSSGMHILRNSAGMISSATSSDAVLSTTFAIAIASGKKSAKEPQAPWLAMWWSTNCPWACSATC
jgi:hypothetical protein